MILWARLEKAFSSGRCGKIPIPAKQMAKIICDTERATDRLAGKLDDASLFMSSMRNKVAEKMQVIPNRIEDNLLEPMCWLIV